MWLTHAISNRLTNSCLGSVMVGVLSRSRGIGGGVELGDGGAQLPGVRMPRTPEDLVRRALLDGHAVLHDEDAVAEVADRPEVVRDEQVAEPGRALQRDEQVE